MKSKFQESSADTVQLQGIAEHVFQHGGFYHWLDGGGFIFPSSLCLGSRLQQISLLKFMMIDVNWLLNHVS